ncbi:ABC-type uncharacterized transport system, periplasmic component [Hoeflea phototrophica DFL-43]|jgi:ABC-type uncharacterized transport system substrate-binding protein|uniref:ABC-type uncharacterized transport system, periplasmic component n=2 Tax=Hoeflea TaxID=274591 RepID=A9D1V1_HOEPD|nr:ABC-type uncharacterized transport system, periplasmic component [Hoeflea phototrophica DFL-43]
MIHSLTRHMPALAALAALLIPGTAAAHPHIFAEARLEVETSANGQIAELRHVWRFDEVFSSSVMLDFDRNGNFELDREELASISEVVTDSLKDFDYYTSLTVNGGDMDIELPEAIKVAFQDGQLLMFFAVLPKQPLPMSGTIAIGVFDPTMYAALDFMTDDDMVVTGAGAKKCASQVVRPDPDEVIAQNQGSLTEAFFNEPTGNDLSKLFATRLELDCK